MYFKNRKSNFPYEKTAREIQRRDFFCQDSKGNLMEEMAY